MYQSLDGRLGYKAAKIGIVRKAKNVMAKRLFIELTTFINFFFKT